LRWAIVLLCVVATFGGSYLLSLEAYAIPITQQTPTIPACGARSVSDITLSENKTPKGKFARAIRSGDDFGILDFRILKGVTPAQDRFYTLAEGGRLRIYDHRYRLTREVTLPEVKDAPSIALDPDGNIYAATKSRLVKFTATGGVVWTRSSGFDAEAYVYGYDSGEGYRIGVLVGSGSEIFDTSGGRHGNTPVTGRRVNQSEATGNLISTSDSYVRVYSRDGATQKLYFGTDLESNDQGPFHFYVLNAADQLADGTIVVSDTGNGLELFADDGSYLGLAGYGGEADNGVTGFIGYDTTVAAHRGKIYYPLEVERVNADLASMEEADVRQYAAQPQGVPGRLGVGAGPFTKAPGNYFPAGTTPQIFLQFYPWWSTVASGLTGEYTIRDVRQLRDKVEVKPTTFIPEISATGITDVPVTLPSTKPGFYQMDVRLIRKGRTIGADCLNFGIGPPGATLDPTKLGSGNVAKINLAKEFGLKLFRADFDLSELLSDDPTAPLKFPKDFDAEWKATSKAATAAGVTLEVQIATGSDSEKKLVEAGTWADRVKELVTRLKPYVHAWEPWNEPNATYGDAAAYTTKVLKPAYTAVKEADPSATFVGGGVLGVDLPYVDQMIGAGALSSMDALSIHAYTGHNRSFEEQGTLATLQSLRARLAAAGKPKLPIWDTESGFWNSQVSSYLHQGDKLVRKVVLENSVGIDKYNNFLLDGAYTVEGQNWGLWQDKITPGGLAMINFGVQTRGLVFKKLLDTNIPHVYAALYGPQDGEGTLLIAWAEDFSVEALVGSVDVSSIVDEWGQPVPAHRSGKADSVTLSGAPIYAQVEKGTSPTLSAFEDFGENLALAKNGATATATSETPWNPPAAAIDGVLDTQDKGSNNEGTSAWIQKYTDEQPALTINLGQPRQLDRILVSSQGIDSVQTGLRSYDVQLQNGDGNWKTVASVRDDFLARNHLVSFAAQQATMIRLANMTVNYSGYSFGLKPLTWENDAKALNQDDVWGGQAVIYEVEAYPPGSTSGNSPPRPHEPGEGSDTSPTRWPWMVGVLSIAAVAAGIVLLRVRRRQTGE
jgi:hypothetical protein